MSIEDSRDTLLERRVASEVVRILQAAPADTASRIAPTAELCSLLERFLPHALRQRYPEWAGESLDGVFIARATKTNPDVLELLGTCILISDQTLTSFYAKSEATPSDGPMSFDISVGEPGDGFLGISGPSCNSGRAARFQQRLSSRFDLGEVSWVYSVTK